MNRVSLLRTAACLAAVIAIPALAHAASLYQRTFEPAHGGSNCYYRAYTAAERRRNPSLKIYNIVLRTTATNLTGGPSGSRNFGLNLGVQTANNTYTALTGCKPKGPGFACDVEADGGSYTLQRVGRDFRIVTRRISIDAGFSELEIDAQRGKPARSFTLRRSPAAKCDRILELG
jgi:hypothetical protein